MKEKIDKFDKNVKLLSSKWFYIFKNNQKTSHSNISSWTSASASGVPNLWHAIYIMLKHAKQCSVLSTVDMYNIGFRIFVMGEVENALQKKHLATSKISVMLNFLSQW